MKHLALWVCFCSVAIAAAIPPRARYQAAVEGAILVLVEWQPGKAPTTAATSVLPCKLRANLLQANASLADATEPCLAWLESNDAVKEVEIPPAAFPVAAESISLMRSEVVAVFGAGLDDNESDPRQGVIEGEACFSACAKSIKST